MKIGELARRTGLSADTIRYYEKIGLMPRADRDSGGRRDYDAAILGWVDFIGRLKTTGMSLREMRRYAELRSQGSRTTLARQKMLAAHRDKVAAHIAALQSCLRVLDEKIAGYAPKDGDQE
ncbi:MerR family transcriptional regulator [Tabrizicola sp.]|uniref:MerR family transcriptional regulator n=1 Tax=Tabrizicola sp. TaxID=2005166 RepID=UPI003F2C340F